jgi:NAD(P)-dependent dehydrogenase (short-subunit alcohol dehydrogenase family)
MVGGQGHSQAHSAGQEKAVATTTGRVAIITGASRGIGRALALGLSREGWQVVIAAKSTESTERLVRRETGKE